MKEATTLLAPVTLALAALSMMVLIGGALGPVQVPERNHRELLEQRKLIQELRKDIHELQKVSGIGGPHD